MLKKEKVYLFGECITYDLCICGFICLSIVIENAETYRKIVFLKKLFYDFMKCESYNQIKSSGCIRKGKFLHKNMTETFLSFH